MKLSNLKPAKGAVQSNSKRVGRGQASGKGGTATRGHKGAKSRSGYSKKIGFEGGQMPLQRRVPKFGFKNINRKEYTIINLDDIQKFIESGRLDATITLNDFVSKGLFSKNDLIKIGGRGELSTKVDITAHKFTASAIDKIKAQGGSASTI